MPVKGGTTRDIPLPAAVGQFLHAYVGQVLATEVERRRGKVQAPITGKNVWRLCKTYGRVVGYPMLKPHDLRHGAALEVLEAQRHLEAVRALLGHTRIGTTQVYANIKELVAPTGFEPVFSD